MDTTQLMHLGLKNMSNQDLNQVNGGVGIYAGALLVVLTIVAFEIAMNPTSFFDSVKEGWNYKSE